ncbi:MAG: glycyl-radical enzyme activating protein [Magnetococcales bacterium]|nr:glycyl-radical enzyme activating protein [Magnetococcales bacterium]
MDDGPKGLLFDIKRNSSEDGPGIRTTLFFKGCPLSCSWCHNLEGLASRASLLFEVGRCRTERCGAPCLSRCESGCLMPGEVSIQVQHARCARCDACFSHCPSGALRPSGWWMEVDELLERVLIDAPFFLSSGGGVTCSGGEPTAQMAFLHLLLRGLKARGIHTALESCGHFDYDRFQHLILPYLDLIYFDLKLMDEAESRRHTGRSNRRILDNFIRLNQEATIPIRPRIPLIPGITDRRENLIQLGAFLRRHQVGNCSLLPYNPMSRDRGALFGSEIPGAGRVARYPSRGYMTAEEAQRCAELLFNARP